jgi:hypothetical protein
MARVREQTIRTKRPPLVGRNLGFLDRSVAMPFMYCEGLSIYFFFNAKLN